MPRYVALLRGINVGGHNKVAMTDLRDVAAALGHADVATYIQSGNVVFTSDDTDAASMADALEREIRGPAWRAPRRRCRIRGGTGASDC